MVASEPPLLVEEREGDRGGECKSEDMFVWERERGSEGECVGGCGWDEEGGLQSAGAYEGRDGREARARAGQVRMSRW